MQANSQDILEAFSHLPEPKNIRCPEIIKRIAMLDIPPFAGETLTESADAFFLEYDKMEAADAESKLRKSLVD